VATTIETRAVSPNNPCPFLRAMVAHGLLPDDRIHIGALTHRILAVAKTGDGAPQPPALTLRLVALIANGLSPRQIARNASHGTQLDALRNGPLDKHGVSSAILDANAAINALELQRVDEFASDKIDAQGQEERGLNLPELKRMMDANFARAAGRRRAIDRALMDGEWPLLLQVLGKQGRDERYLSVADVRQLFAERRFPERMAKQFG
jgi:hypothetical protein